MKEHWTLDPSVTFLNHGSFGAAPRRVLEAQAEWRARMEREPVLFLARELESLIDDARNELAAFLGADPAGVAFVSNATAGVNAVLRSLDLDQHDELLVINHEYNASRNALDFVCSLEGAKVIAIDVPFPIASPDVVVDRVLERVTSRTRLLLIDHITSQTGLVFPIERIVTELNARGIDTLVDGAHGPGQVPLALRDLKVAYYTGNLHKWVCAPKGAAFLYVRENRRYKIRPTSISHGANATRPNRSRYLLEFDWTGTVDPTPWLCVPEALHTMAALVDGGWQEVMRRNHALAIEARDILAAALHIDKPAPDDMLGAMAAVPLPDTTEPPIPPFNWDALQKRLFEEHRIEVPINIWPEWPKRVLRVSAQLYNVRAEYEKLAEVLAGELTADG